MSGSWTASMLGGLRTRLFPQKHVSLLRTRTNLNEHLVPSKKILKARWQKSELELRKTAATCPKNLNFERQKMSWKLSKLSLDQPLLSYE